MSSYTCISCHVAFSDPELQRQHYKTDWHRYNLKRKVVGMPPASASVFQDKVKEHRVTASNKALESISGFFCKLCQKRFNTHNAFENHKKSKKHKEFEKKHMELLETKVNSQSSNLEKSSEVCDNLSTLEKAIADAKADIEQPRILRPDDKTTAKDFASGDNPRMRWFKKQEKALKDEDVDMWEDIEDDDDEEWETLEDEKTMNVEESSDHPKDEDADMESLPSDAVKQRLLTTSECLFCLKGSKDSEENVLHMSQNHGFFIPDIEFLADLEGLLLYLGEKVGMGNICLWCNEKGKAFYSISAVMKHMKDKGHCNMLVTGDAALEYADFYDFGNDEEYEDLQDEEETEASNQEVDSQELELVLPSGALIGHRSLLKYYKQKFPTIERHSSNKERTLARLISQYKVIGWHGSGTLKSQMHKDLAYVRSMKAKYALKLGKNNNKTQMKHFRPQVIF